MAHETMGITYVTDSGATDNAYVAFKGGRVQVYKADGTLLFQFGFRDSDGDGAVDVAKPGDTLA